MGKTDLLFLTLHWEMAVPPSGTHRPAVGSQGELGCGTVPFPAANGSPDAAPSPGSLAASARRMQPGEVSPWVFLRDFCVQTRLAGCACRKEIKGEKRSPADTYKALTPQEHSLGSLRFLFCLLFENNFTSKLVHRL